MSGSELRSFLPAVKSSVASIPWMAAFHDPPPKPHISRGSCHTGKTLTKKAESGQMGAMTEDTDISSINIFSIGYEGKPIGAFIAMLKQNGVVRLIDVRQAPYSRKPGFSKKPLEEALQAAGIDYVGIPELGTDKASRDAHKSDENIAPILREELFTLRTSKDPGARKALGHHVLRGGLQAVPPPIHRRTARS
jgi:hypothetical protein